MKTQSSFRLSGALLMLSSVLTILCFELLRQHFQYPDILRRPTGYVLEQYQRTGTLLRVLWYGMTLGSLLLIPTALLFHRGLQVLRVSNATFTTGLGVLAGLFNTLGFMRWVFMVPALAATYTNPGSSMATRDATQVVFEAFHLYLGFSVGEHLGFIMLAGWGIALAVVFRPYFPAWFTGLGLAASLGTLLGILEAVGWAPAATVVALSSSTLLVWLLLLGFRLLRFPSFRSGKPQNARPTYAS